MDALGRSSGASDPTRVRPRAAPLIASPATRLARGRHGDSSHRPPRSSLSSLPSRPHSTRRLSPKRYDNRYEVEERTNFAEYPFHALRCIKVRERAKAARTLALGSSLRSQLAGSEVAVAARRLNPASSDLTITGTPGSPTCFICSTRASLGVP